MAELNPRRLAQVNLSRIKHGERVFAATPETVLHLGDVVMVVGSEDELDKMTLLLGERTDERMDVNADAVSMDVEVMDESLTGKTLAQHARLGAVHGRHHPHPPSGIGDRAAWQCDA